MGSERGTTGGSHSSSGTARAGRRERLRARPKPSFWARNRVTILTVAVVAAAVLAIGFVFLQSTQKVYACSVITPPASPPLAASSTPAPSPTATTAPSAKASAGASPSASPSPSPSPTPVLGQPESDMGFGHIAVGTVQRYTFCPPASGPHNAVTGFAPISPLRQIYGPDDTVAPQQWIHNLEHGALVVLYSCKDGCPDDAAKQQLQQFFDDFPASPLCNIAPHLLSPVVARFDEMSTKYAAVVWDRILLLDTFDQAKILAFFNQWGERTNREKQPSCTTPGSTASPQAGTSPGVSESPSPSAGTSPSVEPSASPSPS